MPLNTSVPCSSLWSGPNEVNAQRLRRGWCSTTCFMYMTKDHDVNLREAAKCSPHSLSIFLPRPRKLPQECCLYVVGKNGAKTTIFQPVGSRNLINGFSYWRRRSLTGGLYNNIFRINSYSRLRKGIFRTVNWCPFELLVKSTLEYVTYSAHTNKGRR